METGHLSDTDDQNVRVADLERRLAEANTEIELLRGLLDRQVVTDPSTGLATVRGMLEHVARFAAEAVETRGAYAVVRVDVPELAEAIRGGTGAEEALAGLAALIRESARDSDVVGHAEDGGFIVAMPQASEDDALALISELAELLEGSGEGGARPLAPIFAAVIFEGLPPGGALQVLDHVAEARRQARAGEPVISRVALQRGAGVG